MDYRILELPIDHESDIAIVRQRAKKIAWLAGLSIYDQARFATSLAEVATNAVKHAGGGSVEFSIVQPAKKQFVQAVVVDQGPGITDLDGLLRGTRSKSGVGPGLAGARKLVDRLTVDSDPSSGTVVVLAKAVPVEAAMTTEEMALKWSEDLAGEAVHGDAHSRGQENRDLFQALAELRHKERDLKRQLRKVHQLNEKLDALSLVASKTDNAVIITDKEGLVEWVNDGFVRITGYDPFEIVGRKPGDVLQGPLTDRRTVREIREGLKSKKSFTVEILNYHKLGHPYWISMNIFPILDRQGEVLRFMAIQNEVTQHRHAEEELQAAKEVAESANRAKSEFLANMSHEIRTPMNAVIGMTELAMDCATSPEQREYLTTVKQSAGSLLRLLDDILDFSKIEARRFEIDSVNFGLRETLDETMKGVALSAHQKNLELACQVSPETPDALIGDPTRVRQIIVNLVGNAIKFTDRGEIIVHVALEKPTEDSATLHFRVTDTGIGIPDDQKERIFEAFAQADASTTRRFGGTGLGLAITSHLIQLMDGRIWVESEVTHGSTFHFTARFGLQPGARVPYRRTHLDAEVLRGLRVLVVDDNVNHLRILSEMLAAWEMQPVTACCGSTATELLWEALKSRQKFPLVLLDASLGAQDGFVIASRIADAQLATSIVLMLSSADRQADVARTHALGINHYITKPVNESEVRNALLAASGANARRSSAALPSPQQPEPSRPLKVLLVEDTPANQKLAMKILQKRGHAVIVASTGQEAIDTFARQRFDCILMDVQMPDIDGFEATAAIRRLEAEGGTAIPIIAMTAHAMIGDRERCLAAGMSEYISKPLDARKLVQLVEQLGEPDDVPPQPALDRNQEPAAFDFRRALRRLENDLQLFRDLADFFKQDSPALMSRIREAADQQDAQRLEIAAHSLKGLVKNFDADRAVDVAAYIESQARDGITSNLAQAMDELQRETARLESALDQYLQSAN